MVRLPNLPDLNNVFSAIDKAGNAIDKGLGLIDKVSDRLDKIGLTEESPSSIPNTLSTIQEPETVATACVPCALGHFSTSAGLLNEAVRFEEEGITSNEILDRIAKVLEEQNALERKDLTPENIQSAPQWERKIAEEALRQSRKLRHALESFTSIEQIEQTAADTSSFYKKLNREWFKCRFAHLGPEKAQKIADKVGRLSPEDKERVLKRAEELVEEA